VARRTGIHRAPVRLPSALVVADRGADRWRTGKLFLRLLLQILIPEQVAFAGGRGGRGGRVSPRVFGGSLPGDGDATAALLAVTAEIDRDAALPKDGSEIPESDTQGRRNPRPLPRGAELFVGVLVQPLQQIPGGPGPG